MATHRRGARKAQWPIRDLLSEQRSSPSALRDPRLYAAVGGLLACGAAATVAFTASDGGLGGGSDAGGPLALPVPGAAAPAPSVSVPPSSALAPSVSLPSVSRPSLLVPPRVAPSGSSGGGSSAGGSSGGGSADGGSSKPGVGGRRSVSMQAITDRMAAERRSMRSAARAHEVPPPRAADGPAHRAPAHDDPTHEGAAPTDTCPTPAEDGASERHRSRGAHHAGQGSGRGRHAAHHRHRHDHDCGHTPDDRHEHREAGHGDHGSGAHRAHDGAHRSPGHGTDHAHGHGTDHAHGHDTGCEDHPREGVARRADHDGDTATNGDAAPRHAANDSDVAKDSARGQDDRGQDDRATDGATDDRATDDRATDRDATDGEADGTVDRAAQDATDQPAMTAVSGSARHDRGRAPAAHHIDPAAVLAALDDLEHAGAGR